jgi:hypothetical protein
MKSLDVVVFCFLSLGCVSAQPAFITPTKSPKQSQQAVMSTDENPGQPQPQHPFCDLPGDPSMHIVTNVDLADKKLDIMKGETRKVQTSN